MAFLTPPSWPFRVGVRLAEDFGNGMGIRLSWNEAVPSNPDNQVHYNVYVSDTRLDILSSPPSFVTTARQATVLTEPGNLHYFLVRATEFDPTVFDLTEMTQVGLDLFQYPESQTLLSDIDSYAASIEVNSTSGFPDSGYLLIDSEVIRYSSKNTTTFFVEDDERGQLLTDAVSHFFGSEVSIWKGIEEDNTVIFQQTATYFNENSSPQDDDAIGLPEADEDGYKAVPEDNINTDKSAQEVNDGGFPTQDRCSYRRISPVELLSGQCTSGRGFGGSYAGGEFNGLRGLNLQDRNLARQEELLSVTGEPVILLKRKWTGRRSKSFKNRREHQRYRVPNDYGTGFEGGYDRYFNTRSIPSLTVNDEGKILVRIEPFKDDVKLTDKQALEQDVTISGWTTAVPKITDRDLIIRFTQDNRVEFIYEILDVTRNVTVLGQTGSQKFTMKRLDKTDEVYKFPYTDSSTFVFPA